MEEEEAILMVELKGLPNPELINKCKNVSILGLDTTEPILQLENHVFKGAYEDVPGTYMIFSPSGGKLTFAPIPQNKDRHYTEQLSYLCKTSKKLSMTKVLLHKNAQTEEEHEGSPPPHPPIAQKP